MVSYCRRSTACRNERKAGAGSVRAGAPGAITWLGCDSTGMVVSEQRAVVGDQRIAVAELVRQNEGAPEPQVGDHGVEHRVAGGPRVLPGRPLEPEFRGQGGDLH